MDSKWKQNLSQSPSDAGNLVPPRLVKTLLSGGNCSHNVLSAKLQLQGSAIKGKSDHLARNTLTIPPADPTINYSKFHQPEQERNDHSSNIFPGFRIVRSGTGPVVEVRNQSGLDSFPG